MWEELDFKVARFEVHKAVSIMIGVLLGNWFMTFCWIVATSPFRVNHGLIIILKKKYQEPLAQ
jgi:hypothetical protein